MIFNLHKMSFLLLMFLFAFNAHANQDTAPDFSCDPGGRERQQLRLRRQARQPRLRRRDLLPHRPCARKPLSHKRAAPVQQPVRVRQPLGLRLGLKLRQANLHLSRRLRHAPERMRLEDPLHSGAPQATSRQQENQAPLSRTQTARSFTPTKRRKGNLRPQGRLTSMTDAKGNSLPLTYTGSTRKASGACSLPISTRHCPSSSLMITI